MKVLKFKGWNTQNKVMYSAEELGKDELQIHPNGQGFFNASGVNQKLSQYYPHIIPLQFTGNIDRNGVEIYESDIRREEIEEDDGDRTFYFVCTWIEEWSMFAWLSVTDGEYQKYLEKGAESLDTVSYWTYPVGSDAPETIVCGNIYTHPHLLE